MTRIWILLICFLISNELSAQKFFTREGKIDFFSEAPMENIEAHNNKVLCIMDLEKGQVAVDLLIKAFEFEKKLMQEHFNENYMESDKFPKATFKGRFEVSEDLKEAKEGTYLLPVVGEISIHGVKQTLDLPVELVIKNQEINTKFEFTIKVADHDIEIPNLVVDNIAEEILVTTQFNLKPYKR